MSNTLRYDSLLVRHLVDEMGQALVRQRVKGIDLDQNRRRVTLELGDRSLRWELHPTRGWLALGPTPVRLPDEGSRLKVPRQGVVGAVTAPPDERLLRIRLSGAGIERVRSLVLELMTNQWNALALDGDDRIMAALWAREPGDRVLRPGRVYRPPPPAGRRGVDAPLTLEAWRALLGPVPAAERRRTLIREVAYTSPLNAAAILGGGAAAASDALEAAHERYRALVTAPPAPCLLELGGHPQPYPVPLPGRASEPRDSLLAAFEAAVAGEPEGEEPAGLSAAARERLAAHLERLETRVRRMRAELDEAAPRAEELRRHADLLLSRLHEVEKGRESVKLDALTGDGVVVVELDPRLGPVENANRLYDEARKRERAAERLPGIIEEAEAKRDRVAGLIRAADAGEDMDGDTGEALAALLESLTRDPDARADDEGPTLPYRRYRTSGGHEVRVGRGGKGNDALTFHHSAPDDVWLHARSVAGAHVILRWGHREGNPPQRDLLEAAILAALNSKARTSGTVAVDWTRRKYVRKPRKAPPGLVLPDRVSTIFVEPDAGLEKRLRVD